MGKHFPLLTKEVKLISVRMVFPSELGPGSEPEDPVTSSYSAMRAARFVKQLGAGVVRVVHRCDAALEEETLDMSSNSFLELPPVLARLPSLSKLVARKNFVSSLEVEGVLACPSLEHLNMEENPLRKEVYEELATITTIRVILSPREMEEWEDLSC